jgi:hypothetical protein
MRRLWNLGGGINKFWQSLKSQNYYPLPLKTLVLFCLVTEAMAQGPRVDSLVVTRLDQHLAVSVQLSGLFSSKVANTIRSGLPAVIRFDFRLIEEPAREVQRLMRSVHILYDVWGERYHITANGHEQFSSSFADMEKICRGYEESKLLPYSRLSSQKTYRLRLQVAVIPISAKQDQQLREWLEASGTAEESAPGEDRSSGFRFNLSKLLSFFLDKKERPFGTSEWAVSPAFRIEQ